ncbi:uncharacterized protein G2W53_015777 [Senna tora]|uniref:Uncharacterized protein n=1 Tax=Senna tora TaxID=362788 RepID=A0A835C660_9FABA|nr:uncharacterized protein G2W53_015777 [Senna tora]
MLLLLEKKGPMSQQEAVLDMDNMNKDLKQFLGGEIDILTMRAYGYV